MEHFSQAISEPGKKLFKGLWSFVDFLVRHLVMHSCPIFTRVVTAIFTDAGTRCMHWPAMQDPGAWHDKGRGKATTAGYISKKDIEHLRSENELQPFYRGRNDKNALSATLAMTIFHYTFPLTQWCRFLIQAVRENRANEFRLTAHLRPRRLSGVQPQPSQNVAPPGKVSLFWTTL